MITRALLAFAASLCLAHPALAGERWALTYEEEGRVVVDEYARAVDGWQDRVSRRIFQDVGAAQAATALRSLSLRDPLVARTGLELRTGGTVLWTATQSWNWEWEKRYADWIATEVDAQFFKKHDLATDCADVLYALRWIFARIHKLEMASRLAGSGDFLTHRSARSSWASLPTHEDWSKDRRFRAALDYLLDNTFTHSLMTDSYPIKISREAVTEGVYHLDIFRETGHTQILHRLDSRGQSILPFLIIQSTVPRKVRELSVAGFWYTEQPKPGKGGLLRMRWPSFSSRGVSLLASEKMPFYSLEQYAPDFRRSDKTPYNQEVYLRINPSLDFRQVLGEAWESIKAMYRARVSVVEEGYAHCSRVSCAPGTPDEDLWSTPTRDGRITELLAQIESIRMVLGEFGQSGNMSEPVVELFGETYTLGMLVQTWRQKRFSSDPNHTPERRWAVSANGILTWAQAEIDQAVRERLRLLSGGKPSTEPDSDLREVRDALAAYCEQFPRSQCAPLWTGLDGGTVAVEGRVLGLRDFLGNIPWMMGRTGESRARQWGEERPTHEWADLFGATTLGMARDQVLLAARPGGWNLGRRTTAGLEISRSGPEQAALRLDGALAWNEGLELLIELPGIAQTPERLTLPWIPERLVFSGRHILARAGVNFVIIGGSAAGWRIEFQGSTVVADEPSAEGLWITQDEQGLLRFFDMSGVELRSWSLAMSQKPVLVAAVNDDAFLLVGDQITSLHRPSGVLSAQPDFGSILTCHSTAPLCLSLKPRSSGGQTIRVHRLGGDGSSRIENEWSGQFAFAQGDLLTIVPTGSPPLSFSWGAGGMNRLALRDDEQFVSSSLGDVWLVQLKNGTQRLREGARVVLESKDPINLLGTSRVYGYFYAVYEGSQWLGSLRGGNTGTRALRLTGMSLGWRGEALGEGLLQEGIWLP